MNTETQAALQRLHLCEGNELSSGWQDHYDCPKIRADIMNTNRVTFLIHDARDIPVSQEYNYTIRTECGLQCNILASSIDDAKEIYSQANDGYDFDGAENGEYPGAWFWVNCDGIRVEDFTADMPN